MTKEQYKDYIENQIEEFIKGLNPTISNDNTSIRKCPKCKGHQYIYYKDFGYGFCEDCGEGLKETDAELRKRIQAYAEITDELLKYF